MMLPGLRVHCHEMLKVPVLIIGQGFQHSFSEYRGLNNKHRRIFAIGVYLSSVIIPQLRFASIPGLFDLLRKMICNVSQSPTFQPPPPEWLLLHDWDNTAHVQNCVRAHNSESKDEPVRPRHLILTRIQTIPLNPRPSMYIVVDGRRDIQEILQERLLR